MAAFCDDFASLVEHGLVAKENPCFLSCAQVTSFCGGAVGVGLFLYLPSELVVLVVLFLLPGVSTARC